MCKACTYWKKEWAKVQDVRDGAIEPDDFEKEVNYQKRLKKKNKRTRSYPGCPGNDGNAHVYIWTTETETPSFFEDYYGFPRRQRRVCAGCGKYSSSKLSDEYMAAKIRRWNKLPDVEKGVPIPWRYNRRGMIRFAYWSWENDDADYMAARSDYIDQHGWSDYVWGY